jgi:signal transduction histidine kinase
MKWTVRLRARAMVALLLIAGIGNVVFAIAFFYANQRLEIDVLDTMLRHEEANFAAAHARDPDAPLPEGLHLKSWASNRPGTGAVPSELARLPEGSHHDISLDGRRYHVLVTSIAAQRIWFAFDATEIEGQENMVIRLLVAGILMNVGLITVLGLWALSRVVVPLMSLTRELELLDPAVRTLTLSAAARRGEVQVIAEAFERYHEKANRLREREASFTAAVSHELRTPLAVLSTSAELLATHKSLDHWAERQIKRIRKSADDVTGLVTSLLALARESRRIVLDGDIPIDLRTFCERLIDDYRHQLDGRSIKVEVRTHTAAAIFCTEADLSIVLGNLLRNAITYTEAGLIEIDVDATSVSIRNPGGAIDPVELERVFDCYYSGVNSFGTGLGLYLAKCVCDRYGWTLTLSSEPAMGVTARVGFAATVPPTADSPQRTVSSGVTSLE